MLNKTTALHTASILTTFSIGLGGLAWNMDIKQKYCTIKQKYSTLIIELRVETSCPSLVSKNTIFRIFL
jgi:hypothetical protein